MAMIVNSSRDNETVSNGVQIINIYIFLISQQRMMKQKLKFLGCIFLLAITWKGITRLFGNLRFSKKKFLLEYNQKQFDQVFESNKNFQEGDRVIYSTRKQVSTAYDMGVVCSLHCSFRPVANLGKTGIRTRA